jgi:hypothetical protein
MASTFLQGWTRQLPISSASEESDLSAFVKAVETYMRVLDNIGLVRNVARHTGTVRNDEPEAEDGDDSKGPSGKLKIVLMGLMMS